jgi:hypothetical protein
LTEGGGCRWFRSRGRRVGSLGVRRRGSARRRARWTSSRRGVWPSGAGGWLVCEDAVLWCAVGRTYVPFFTPDFSLFDVVDSLAVADEIDEFVSFVFWVFSVETSYVSLETGPLVLSNVLTWLIRTVVVVVVGWVGLFEEAQTGSSSRSKLPACWIIIVGEETPLSSELPCAF